MAVITVTGNPVAGAKYTVTTASSADWASVSNNTYFFDLTNQIVYYKNSNGIILYPFSFNEDVLDTMYQKPQEIFRGFTYNNNSSTVQQDGGLVSSASASVSAQSVSSTDFASKQIRARYYASIVQTGRYTGIRGSALLWYIHGGFRFVCDFNISDTTYGSTCQQFYGMAGQTTDLAYGGTGLVKVSTLTNLFGVGNDDTDTNLQVIYNDATGTASKIDLGVNFPANRTVGAVSTTVYSVELINEPASSNVTYRVVNNETGAIATGTLTTDLPATSQGLNLFASRCMGTAVTNTGQFDLMKLGVFSQL